MRIANLIILVCLMSCVKQLESENGNKDKICYRTLFERVYGADKKTVVYYVYIETKNSDNLLSELKRFSHFYLNEKCAFSEYDIGGLVLLNSLDGMSKSLWLHDGIIWGKVEKNKQLSYVFTPPLESNQKKYDCSVVNSPTYLHELIRKKRLSNPDTINSNNNNCYSKSDSLKYELIPCPKGYYCLD